MGTNYYLHRNVCSHCGRGDEPIHIGKSSAGWCFSLHVTDEIQSLSDWRKAWTEGIIKNEYGEIIAPAAMIEVIKYRKWNGSENRSAQFYKDNGAMPGPNGLMRHKLGSHCVGHGEGTWDLIPGEFS